MAEVRIVAVTAVLGLVILTELISILENLDKMGLKVVPKWVRNIVRTQSHRLNKPVQED